MISLFHKWRVRSYSGSTSLFLEGPSRRLASLIDISVVLFYSTQAGKFLDSKKQR